MKNAALYFAQNAPVWTLVSNANQTSTSNRSVTSIYAYVDNIGPTPTLTNYSQAFVLADTTITV